MLSPQNPDPEGPLFIRCRLCQSPIAGPLKWVKQTSLVAISDEPWVPLGGAIRGDKISSDTEAGIFLHPDWSEEWRDGWPKFPSQLRGREGAKKVSDVRYSHYGCCGAQGTLLCPKKHQIGDLYTDCAAPQWLRLDEDAVELSSSGEGWWEVYRLDLPVLCREQGMMSKGKREGEWTLYLLQPFGDFKEHEIVGYLTYEAGQLVEELVEEGFGRRA